MSRVAFVDDNITMGRCWRDRDESALRQEIKRHCHQLALYEQVGNDDVIGCTISKNIPLSTLYGFQCLVVKFECSFVETVHEEQQQVAFLRLMKNLWQLLSKEKAYVNLRIPSHIGDLLRAYNSTCPSNTIFCGGTVEEIRNGAVLSYNIKDEISIFCANAEYAEKNSDILQNIAYKSFDQYQGQYHLSPILCSKAGEIYRNWAEQGIKPNSDKSLWVAELHNELVGFVLCRESNDAIDEELAAVSEIARGKGIYKALVASLISEAGRTNRFFVSSTQFDNWGSQTTWAHLGMSLLYSIYNFHYDNR